MNLRVAESGMNEESSTNLICTIGGKMDSCVAQGAQSGTLWGHRGMECGVGREVREEGVVCIIMDDLHCCMAKTNTTL